VAIPELGRPLDLHRDARQIFDDVFADGARGERAAGPHDDDAIELEELPVADVELWEGDVALIVEVTADGVADRLGILVDLLEHVVGVPALLGLGDIPVDPHDSRLDGDAAEVGHHRTQLGDRHHLTLAQHQRLLGVRDDAGEVRADEPFLVAQAHHQGRVEASADEEVGLVVREDHQ